MEEEGFYSMPCLLTTTIVMTFVKYRRRSLTFSPPHPSPYTLLHPPERLLLSGYLEPLPVRSVALSTSLKVADSDIIQLDMNQSLYPMHMRNFPPWLGSAVVATVAAR